MTPISFDNSYARLPERFFKAIHPTAVVAPRLVQLNRPLALQLGLDPDWLASPGGIATLAGNRIADGSVPIATVYAGHQFGGFSPQLGDGRAILLGEVIDRDGGRRDFQLKGAGLTPFSRRGDGRAALGPVLREYIVSEAMAALGVPTTRALAAVLTGEAVRRERVLPGAVLTRVASSHIRIGTFQFFAARGDVEALRLLADYVIARHYPEAAISAAPYLALLEAVIAAQASLISSWMLIGFIHGVMNTDNMSVAGETLDYGPCAFMDAYDSGTVFSAIDERGRYAYGNQPPIARWNLTQFAETLLPLLADDQDKAVTIAQDALHQFDGLFQSGLVAGFRRKIGLATEEMDDVNLIKTLLETMQRGKADFTLVFRRLSEGAPDSEDGSGCRDLFDNPAEFDSWESRWRDRLLRDRGSIEARLIAMRRVNPLFIPRNHCVEAAIEAAVEFNDFAPFEELMLVLANPYDAQRGHERYATPPAADERVLETYCGT